ncbi:MAG: oligosaccharide flippase family protein [Anaerolineales bacterium]|nr:oligosaccharide flippase family protein [Anaerolineales bacterium]
MEPDTLEAFVVQFRKYKEDRVARNSFYSVVQFIVPTLLLLGVTPILIRYMGTGHYGLWMLATSALGLMSIAEFGLNTAIAKFIAEYMASKDTNALAIVVSGGFIAYVLLGTVLVIPLYVYSPALAEVFKSSETLSTAQIGSVIKIISLGLAPLLLRSYAMAIPIGLQRFEIPVVITIGYQILSYAAALIVILLGGSVALVVGSTVGVLWIAAFGALLIAWRMLKPLHLQYLQVLSRKTLQKLFSFALMSGISGIGSRIFSFADRLAVGAVLGLEAVAYYSVIISVAAKILQLGDVLASALMPAVSAWMASGTIRRAQAYFLRATGAVLAINFIVANVLLGLSAPFLRLWMGELFADQALLPFRILIVIYALISLNAPAYHVANGIGIPWLNALGSLLGGSLTIGLILWLGNMSGLMGVAVANAGYLFNFLLIIVTIGFFQSKIQKTSP